MSKILTQNAFLPKKSAPLTTDYENFLRKLYYGETPISGEGLPDTIPENKNFTFIEKMRLDPFNRQFERVLDYIYHPSHVSLKHHQNLDLFRQRFISRNFYQNESAKFYSYIKEKLEQIAYILSTSNITYLEKSRCLNDFCSENICSGGLFVKLRYCYAILNNEQTPMAWMNKFRETLLYQFGGLVIKQYKIPEGSSAHVYLVLAEMAKSFGMNLEDQEKLDDIKDYFKRLVENIVVPLKQEFIDYLNQHYTFETLTNHFAERLNNLLHDRYKNALIKSGNPDPRPIQFKNMEDLFPLLMPMPFVGDEDSMYQLFDVEDENDESKEEHHFSTSGLRLKIKSIADLKFTIVRKLSQPEYAIFNLHELRIDSYHYLNIIPNFPHLSYLRKTTLLYPINEITSWPTENLRTLSTEILFYLTFYSLETKNFNLQTRLLFLLEKNTQREIPFNPKLIEIFKGYYQSLGITLIYNCMELTLLKAANFICDKLIKNNLTINLNSRAWEDVLFKALELDNIALFKDTLELGKRCQLTLYTLSFLLIAIQHKKTAFIPLIIVNLPEQLLSLRLLDHTYQFLEFATLQKLYHNLKAVNPDVPHFEIWFTLQLSHDPKQIQDFFDYCVTISRMDHLQWGLKKGAQINEGHLQFAIINQKPFLTRYLLENSKKLPSQKIILNVLNAPTINQSTMEQYFVSRNPSKVDCETYLPSIIRQPLIFMAMLIFERHPQLVNSHHFLNHNSITLFKNIDSIIKVAINENYLRYYNSNFLKELVFGFYLYYQNQSQSFMQEHISFATRFCQRLVSNIIYKLNSTKDINDFVTGIFLLEKTQPIINIRDSITLRTKTWRNAHIHPRFNDLINQARTRINDIDINAYNPIEPAIHTTSDWCCLFTCFTHAHNSPMGSREMREFKH